MDKNEFLKPTYPLLYNHYWFFGPVLQAPAWQRYLLTFLIIIGTLSGWFFYWYVPLQDKKQRQLASIQQQTATAQRYTQLQRTAHELTTYCSTIVMQQIAPPHLMTTFITLAQTHGMSLESYTPAPAHTTTVPSSLAATSLTLVMHAHAYEQILNYVAALITQYPLVAILDMLIRKSGDILIVHLHLQSINRHEAPSCSSSHSP